MGIVNTKCVFYNDEYKNSDTKICPSHLWIEKSITTIRHVKVFICNCASKCASIAVVYTKVRWNIASNVVYFKSAMEAFQFQVFIKCSHIKKINTKVVRCRND